MSRSRAEAPGKPSTRVGDGSNLAVMAEHDAETLRIGRKNIARIRAQLGVSSSPTARTSDPPTSPEPSGPSSAPDSGIEPSVDRMRLELALADERDQLLATVRRQADRIEHLEAMLASVIRTAAGGLDSSSLPPPVPSPESN